jgi:hypothetical protein
MLIRNDTLEIMSDESKTEIYPIKDMLMWAKVWETDTLVVTQDVLSSLIQAWTTKLSETRWMIWWWVLVWVLIGGLFAAVFAGLFVAIMLFIHGTLIYLLSKAISWWLTYAQAYSMAGWIYTLPYILYFFYPSFWGWVLITLVIAFFIMKRMQQKKNNTVVDVSEKPTDWNLS